MTTMENENWITMAPGIRRQTLVAGERMMQMQVILEAGSQLPEHQHQTEQVRYGLRGRLRLLIAGQPHESGAGETVYLPSGVPHAASVLEDTLVLDTFSPPRDEPLAQDRAHRGNG